jgi:DUF4097 and DUF4098 domain-containing protein YvlB
MRIAMFRVITPFLLLSALALPSRADTPIDESRPVRNDARITIVNCNGAIEVTTWDKNMLSVSGRLGEGAEKLLIEGDEEKLLVEVKLPRFSHNVEASVLKIKVPAGVSLDLDGVSADIDVNGTKGVLKAKSVSGDVRLAVDSPSVQAQTVSGDLHLSGSSRDTQVKTVSGDLSVTGTRGDLTAETVSGDVRLDGGEFSRLRLKSVSGDFRVDAKLAETARAEMDTLSGDIILDLPSSTSASATLDSSSGEVSSEFGAAIGEETRRATLTLGGGSDKTLIKLHSFSGDIQLRKK